MCWLYFVPILLVIQYVEILYLGRNNVRVLATSKSLKYHTCEVCRKLKGHDSWSTTVQKVQSGLVVNLRLKLATHSSCESESPKCPVLLKTDFSHSISYLTINTLIPTKCKGWRKRSLLREKS